MYNHAFMDFAASESVQIEGNAGDRAWFAFCNRVEIILGHDLDGDDCADSRAAGKNDGYSLDGAYDAWRAGTKADDYAASVRANPDYRGGLRHIDEEA